ncbi:class F sortase [Streptomyces sp. NPDC056600]|uniref:class F sortase n=1 Tax=Streptomyces sp. NPDC056600 TaxID=3345874 RepID=UPI0036AB1C01
MTARGSRLLTALTWLTLFAATLVWAAELTDLDSPAGERRHAPANAAPPAAPGPGVRLPPARRPLPAAEPRRIDVPSLGLSAPVVPRPLDPSGAPGTPPMEMAGAVGWWQRGPAPGAAGPALLAGHRDTGSRAAVFHRLGDLRPGDAIDVYRSDGRAARFTVEEVRTLRRAGFDARLAYGPRRPGRAELRLITCAGAWDEAARAYTANVVVFAYLTGSGGR